MIVFFLRSLIDSHLEPRSEPAVTPQEMQAGYKRDDKAFVFAVLSNDKTTALHYASRSKKTFGAACLAAIRNSRRKENSESERNTNRFGEPRTQPIRMPMMLS